MTSIDEQAHAQFVAFNRWRAANEAGTETLDAAGVLAAAGPVDWPSSRAFVRTDRRHDGGEAARAGHEFLMARGKTAIAYPAIGADDDFAAACERFGYTELAQTPEMVCEQPLPARPPAPGVSVRLAATVADVEAYAEVAAQAFSALGIPVEETRRHLSNHAALLADDVVVALAEVEGTPAAGAMVLMVDGGRGGYVAWVATDAGVRGRGLGDAVTRRVTNEAFGRGAGLVSLEASRFGESVYRAMGYRELYRYRMLVKV